MRTLALVCAASCSLMLACVQEAPGGLLDGNSGSGAAGTGTGTGAGSSTGTSTGTSGGTGAQAFFEQNVSPILQAKCATCHANVTEITGAPDFLGPTPADYYGRLKGDVRFVTANPDDSMLLTKGPHAGDLSVFSDDEKADVHEWLEMESEVTNPDNPPAEGDTGVQLLTKFVGCMTKDVYVNSGMPQVSLQGTLNANLCIQCHTGGAGNNWMPNPNDDANVNDVYLALTDASLVPIKTLIYFEPITEGGKTVNQLIQTCRWRDKGEALPHPRYDLAPVYQGYLDDWFAQTLAACNLTTTKPSCE